MGRYFDFLTLIYVPVGFLLGLVALVILGAFEAGFLVTVVVLIATALLIFAGQFIADKLSIWRLLMPKQARDANAHIEKRERVAGRYAVSLGIALAYVASFFWSPQEILEMLP